jgi:hypothetical protein
MRAAPYMILVASLVLSSFASAKSQKPSSSSNPPGNQSAPPSAPDQRGTEQMPLTVKVLPSADAEQKAKDEEHERQDKAQIDRKLAFETQRIADYTFWLELFTLALFSASVGQIALFFWQLRIMQKGIKDTESAANAAKISANAAVDSVELAKATSSQQLRAYVSAFPISILSFYEGKAVEIGYESRNEGNTPAFNVVAFGEVKVLPYPLSQPIEQHIPFVVENPSLGRTVLFPGKKVDHWCSSGTYSLTREDIEDIRVGSKCRLYLFLMVRYEDIFAKTHQTIFIANLGRRLFSKSWEQSGGKLIGQVPFEGENCKAT